MAQPNIVLILTDNQQASTLGCYGNTEVRTPNLDRYAREGMQFRNAFCPNAFCSPCRASVLTGLMPSQHGVHSWIDDRNRQDWPNGWHALAGLATLPELLREQGYRTGLFGKYHLGESATAGPGWDAWVTMEHGHVRSFYNNQITDNGDHYLEEHHSVDFFCRKATEFIAESDQPFFTYVPLPAPYGHWPATQSGQRNRFSHWYDDCPMDSIPRRAISAAAVQNYDRIKEKSGDGLDFSMLMRAPNHVPTYRDYYSQISLVDDAIAQVVDAADAQGDTLVIFTADHGLSLGHHGFWGHGGSTWPSNLHFAAHSIPLIARHPGTIESGSVNDQFVSNLDLFNTLLDYTGAATHDHTPSRSFAPQLRGQAPRDTWGADEVFSEQEETRVIRTGKWAYFRRFSGADVPVGDELFNVSEDPEEAINLVDDPQHADIVRNLSARIDAHFARFARPEADMWRGGQPIQNSMVTELWREAWGDDWAPVYAY